jgi:Ca2+-binding RTX toxin-like protein
MASNAAFVGYAQGSSLPGEDAYESFDFTPQVRKSAFGLSWSDWPAGEPGEGEVGSPVEPIPTNEASEEFNQGVADDLIVMTDDSAPETADTESDTGKPAPGGEAQEVLADEPNDGDESASVETANDEPAQLVWISEADDRDLVYGSEGSDIIDTGVGNDTVSAGAGNDIIHASSGADYIWADDGYDIIILTGNRADYKFHSDRSDFSHFELIDMRDEGQSTLPRTDGLDQVFDAEAVQFGDGIIVPITELLAG